jgi:hypothetical protein
LFSPDHRLQKEAEVRFGQLVIRSNRGRRVEEELQPYGDHTGVSGKLAEVGERGEVLHRGTENGGRIASQAKENIWVGVEMNVLGHR